MSGDRFPGDGPRPGPPPAWSEDQDGGDDEGYLDALLSGLTAEAPWLPGEPYGLPETLVPVADTLAALRAAPAPGELAGEAAARAAFRAIAPAPWGAEHGTFSPGPVPGSMPGSMPGPGSPGPVPGPMPAAGSPGPVPGPMPAGSSRVPVPLPAADPGTVPEAAFAPIPGAWAAGAEHGTVPAEALVFPPARRGRARPRRRRRVSRAAHGPAAALGAAAVAVLVIALALTGGLGGSLTQIARLSRPAGTPGTTAPAGPGARQRVDGRAVQVPARTRAAAATVPSAAPASTRAGVVPGPGPLCRDYYSSRRYREPSARRAVRADRRAPEALAGGTPLQALRYCRPYLTGAPGNRGQRVNSAPRPGPAGGGFGSGPAPRPGPAGGGFGSGPAPRPGPAGGGFGSGPDPGVGPPGAPRG